MAKEIAILMAAGLGTRMAPLTKTKPKPLIKVIDKPMIETVLDALTKRGVSHLYVVVGYLSEQFNYLTEKYDNLSIVENKEYKTINNISSIHAVTDVMRDSNCFVCEADLFIPNPDVLSTELTKSCYFGKMVKGYSGDWLFTLDESGRIIHIGKGGTDCYNMCGVSYFLKEDAAAIADAVDARYSEPGYEDLFWDEVVDSILNKIDLIVHPIENDQIIEIDTIEELENESRKFSKDN